MSDALKPMTAAEFAESLASIPNAYKMDRDYYDRIALALKEREQLREAVKMFHDWAVNPRLAPLLEDCVCRAAALLTGVDGGRQM